MIIWLITMHKFINDWLWLLSKFQPKNWRDVIDSIDSYSLGRRLFVYLVVVVYPAIYRVNVCHFFCCFFWEGSPPKQNDECCAHFHFSGPKIVQIKQGLIPLGKPFLEDWFGRMGMTLSISFPHGCSCKWACSPRSAQSLWCRAICDASLMQARRKTERFTEKPP